MKNNIVVVLAVIVCRSAMITLAAMAATGYLLAIFRAVEAIGG